MEEFYFNLEEAVNEHRGALPLRKPSFPLQTETTTAPSSSGCFQDYQG